MSKFNAGFIGAGHMGKILAAAAIRSGAKVAVNCRTKEHALAAAKELGCDLSENGTLLAEGEMIFLGMRPQDLASFAKENAGDIEKADGTFVSMLAGVTLQRLEDALGADKKIIRIMPNTPCAVGKGLIFCAAGKGVGEKEKQKFEKLLSGCAKIEWIDEKDMDAVCVAGGCGPAYVYAYADALAKAGEAMGLTREAAVSFVARMMAGSAAMMLESGKDPETLRKEVCSPGGATIEGVKILEAKDLEGITKEALMASFNRTKGL